MPALVLYIVGTTRCGSTVLGNLLGQAPGMVHVGELAQIWDEGFVRDFRCGCGAAFHECPFWSRVVGAAFGGQQQVAPERLLAVVRTWARTRHALRLATASGRARMVDGMAEHTDAMARLYRAILEVAGARIVVDSSKTPLLAWIAAQHRDIQLQVLHVTRDPRAVAYSWQRKRFDPAKTRDMDRESPVKTSLAWLTWNGLAAGLWGRGQPGEHYLQVRYEDFAADPQGTVAGILAWMGEATPASALIGADGTFTAAPAHTIAGNPMRFRTGVSRVVADTEWQERASGWDRLLVSGLTWPLLGRYRYPLRAPARKGQPG